jgi:regulator of protease activity HflC (stomatin/prohibitin superfamily)
VAEGDKESRILRADADKQARILAAEAEAEAIRQVNVAVADALLLLNAAAPNEQVIKLKALETFKEIADGKATKIIIPSEIQSLAGLVGALKEAASNPISE